MNQANLMRILKNLHISNEDMKNIYQALGDGGEIELDSLISLYDEVFYLETEDKKVNNIFFIIFLIDCSIRFSKNCM